MADPVMAFEKFKAGGALSREEVAEATLYVLTQQLGELEHLCNRMGLLLNAQGIDVAVVNQEPLNPNGEPGADT